MKRTLPRTARLLLLAPFFALLTAGCGGENGIFVPQIISQPASQTVNVGDEFFLSVVAVGTSPQYQWYKNGSAINDATDAVYSVTSAVAGDAGTYAVVVWNEAGSTTSDQAVVTVN